MPPKLWRERLACMAPLRPIYKYMIFDLDGIALSLLANASQGAAPNHLARYVR